MIEPQEVLFEKLFYSYLICRTPTDTESGDTIVTIEAGSAGSVLIKNCTTK